MNNEPVAWAIKSDGDWTEIGWDDEVLHEVEEWYTAQGWQYEYVPLYTYPAKTLTDEEILDICIKFGFYDRISDPHFDDKTGAWSLDEDLIQFARAILRKAQEK